MLRISILDSSGQRLLVLEGALSAPWVDELSRAWAAAHAGLQNRKLVIDLKNVTVISPDGEKAILKLMSEGAKFRSRGVLTRHVLRELARRNRKNAGQPDRGAPARNAGAKRTP
jgi:hypothetical protein